MDLSTYLNALTAYFVIIDPIGTALIFNALCTATSVKARAVLAFRIVLISSLLLILFALYGKTILAQLGISIYSLRIAGGLLLFYTAFNMVTSTHSYKVANAGDDIAVFPMSVPLIAGPGSLTVSILLYASAYKEGSGNEVILAAMTICGLTFFALLSSGGVKRMIGKTGDEILRRFLGVLLAALAIQFIMDGVAGFNI
jgi:multiple antibiotic resistance protein